MQCEETYYHSIGDIQLDDGHEIMVDDPVYSPPLWYSLMEQKTDWLKEATAELTRKLQEREASAQQIKRCCMLVKGDNVLLIYCVCSVRSAARYNGRLTT